MDSIYNNKPTKSLNGVLSPVNMQQLTVDPTQATLMRYLRGGAPITPSSSVNSSRSSNSSFRRSLSATETAKSSPSAYRTPVKMIEEDVLVMDGILVASAPGVRASRSSSSSTSSGSSTNHASVAGSSLLCSSGERSVHKTELCVAWEDFSQCHFGSNCQFAHGKEELHPTHFSVKNKSEAHACKTYPSGSSSHGKNYPLLPLVLMEAASQKASPTGEPECPCKSTSFTAASPESSSKNSSPIATPEPLGRTSQAIIPGGYKKRPAKVGRPGDSRTLVTTSETLVTTSECWSPLDDGIMVALPVQTDKYSSRKGVDACIESALYGPTRKKRLPVFTEFCPDN